MAKRGGWALAGLGAVLATTLGAALAGFLLLAGLDPVGALILPPAFVWKALIDTPVTAAIWFSGISLTHLAARRHSLK